MAKLKIDGLVEAVHYNSDGQVAWVRAYIRRGATYSDCVMIDRQTVISRIKKGSHYYVGGRIPRLASTFDVKSALRVLEKNGRDLLVAGEREADQDYLEGVLLI